MLYFLQVPGYRVFSRQHKRTCVCILNLYTGTEKLQRKHVVGVICFWYLSGYFVILTDSALLDISWDFAGWLYIHCPPPLRYFTLAQFSTECRKLSAIVCFSLLRSVIGSETRATFSTNQMQNQSQTLWLAPMIFSSFLIGCCDHCGFGFTKLIEMRCAMPFKE